MKTVEAEIVHSRIVTCKKCGQRNRIYERTDNGLYRCASCKTVMSNPFLWQQWLARLKQTGGGKLLAVVSVAGLLIYAISLQIQLGDVQSQRNNFQIQLGDMQSQRDSAVKESGENKAAIEKLQNAQSEDRAQIAASAAEVLQKASELDSRRNAIQQELVKIGIPADQAAAIINPAVTTAASAQVIDDALLRPLPTDYRPPTGLLNRNVNLLAGWSAGLGKLTLKNGNREDAHVKIVWRGILVVSCYVRGGDAYTVSNIPDNSYDVLYCTGYGWNKGAGKFNRGLDLHAYRFDDPLDYSTRDRGGYTEYAITLTLNPVPSGTATRSDISVDEFDRY
jgi:hypothetical protein